MQKRLIYITTILLLLIGVSSFAQDVTFTAATSHNTVKTGDRFQIEFRANTQIKNFKAPSNLSSFRVLSGPNQSTNMSWVNGKTTSSITYSYVLMAIKEGTFTLKPASAVLNGKEYKTNTLKISVGKGVPVQQNSKKKQKNQQVNVSDDIFLKASVNKSKVYQGEQLIATYKVYTRLSIAGGEPGDDIKLNGFWQQEIDIGDVTWSTEVIGGYQWKVATLKKMVLFPQRSGALEVDPLEMKFIVQKRAKGRSNNLMDQFFGRVENVEYNCKSKPIKINVLPHPKPEPEDYNGAVGKLNMTVDVSANEVKANEAINIKIKVSGKGNINLIDDLPIDFPSDFETYDPKIKDNIKTTANGVNGSREFDYLVIPRHPGEFDLGTISFSYFDPAAKKFKTITSNPIKINVLKGDGSANDNVTYSSANKEEIKVLGNDIRFIHTTNLKISHSNSLFYGSFIFYLLLLLAPLLFLLTYIFRNKIRTAKSDVVGMKKKRANKIAAKLLISAKSSLATNNKNAFYEDISKALFGYISNKLNIAVSELNENNIKQQLASINVSENTIKDLIDTINLCDMARFAPVSVSEQEVYNKAEAIINKIEGEV